MVIWYAVKFDLTRLAILLLGDRLVAAAVQRNRVETFVVDAENPAAALRAELDQRELGMRGVAIGLPRSAVTVKPIELPSVDGEVTEMVRFELERHLPYGGEDTPFDFVPLPPNGSGTGGRQVLIAAADRRVVDGALRIVEDAKLRPLSITVAAHNLISLVTRRRRGRVAWVHRIGPSVEVLFLDGPSLVLSRSLADADDTLVAEELRRSFAITHWRDCEEIWLSGDADPASPGALAELGVPVVEPPYTPRARRRLAALGDAPRGASELAVAVASAGRIRPLDLIPAALRPRHLTRGQILSVGLGVLMALLGVVALLVPGYRENRRLATLDAEVASLDPEVRAVEKIIQELDRKRRLVGTVQSVQAQAVRPLPVLRELTDLLPTDAWLTMLSLDAKGVELTGQAGAAATLIPLLENSARLERVEFASPVTRGRDKEQFRIRASWEGGPGAVATAPVAPAPRAVAPAAPRVVNPAAAAGAPATPGAPQPPRSPAAPAPGTTQPPAASVPGAPQPPAASVPGTTQPPAASVPGTTQPPASTAHDSMTPAPGTPPQQPNRPITAPPGTPR